MPVTPLGVVAPALRFEPATERSRAPAASSLGTGAEPGLHAPSTSKLATARARARVTGLTSGVRIAGLGIIALTMDPP
jgi:hypothetical protein